MCSRYHFPCVYENVFITRVFVTGPPRDGKPSLVTRISSLRESTAVVSTRIISVFFENGSPVSMSGTAIISFAESRKLISVGAHDSRK